ncbi:MAG TPA: endonuclease/exonuclease/phosphatase family protein [Candidatus Limnocylindrales bacterium]|nr:endonuclease/exonuclease/phosphatase family protein [Candidatus Limnocylindrales bacterium]
MSRLFAALAALALVAVGINVLLAPQTGPFALAAVFEPHLLAAGAVAGLLAILLTLSDRGGAAPWIRLLGVTVIVVAFVRVGGEWWSPEPTDAAAPADGATRVSLMSWNLEAGSKAAAETMDGILDIPDDEAPDVVALQELTPDAAAVIEASDELDRRYPYRVLEPRDGVRGMGILSSLPLVAGVYGARPMLLTASVLLDDGSRLDLVNAHPFPPRVESAFGFIPIGVDTRQRDRELGDVRDAVDVVEDPARVILVGDLNVTPFEGGFAPVADGLADAHATVGVGTGFTWRPSWLEGWGLGLLRIDHVLSGEAVTPVASDVNCSLPGDHCRLTVTLDVAPAP